jgi:hypothetical protein
MTTEEKLSQARNLLQNSRESCSGHIRDGARHLICKALGLNHGNVVTHETWLSAEQILAQDLDASLVKIAEGIR